MVQSGVDLVVCGVDWVGVSGHGLGVWIMDQTGEWPVETQPKLDQQDAKFESETRQAVASAAADTLNEAFRAKLAQVVPKLAQAVLIAGKVMASDDAGV